MKQKTDESPIIRATECTVGILQDAESTVEGWSIFGRYKEAWPEIGDGIGGDGTICRRTKKPAGRKPVGPSERNNGG